MRTSCYIITALFLLAAITSAFPRQSAPRISEARLKGNKLIVTGSDFDRDAAVFINGERQKTRNDEGSPATRLVARNAGKNIARDEIVSLKVQNPGGLSSDEFPFYTGRSITLADNDGTVRLRVGERFMLRLGDGFVWRVVAGDPALISQVAEAPLVPGGQGVFHAIQPGITQINAMGAQPCPAQPCPPGPVLGFRVVIRIE
jgi:hypothetical protein